ncbi:hypothetical protein N0V86_000403 [Didymella sp. IMI 355093]|nr:hypothetical protein N0V86_000403 [Didymella sp. IMI 355093]
MPSAKKIVLALVFLTAAAALPTPQLAGEGTLFGAVFPDTDDAIGYSVKDIEENTAKLVSSAKNDLSSAAGTGDFTKTAMDSCDTVDGELTDAAGEAGENIGSTELSTLTGIAKAIPRL